jgi:hypothetical protein
VVNWRQVARGKEVIAKRRRDGRGATAADSGRIVVRKGPVAPKKGPIVRVLLGEKPVVSRGFCRFEARARGNVRHPKSAAAACPLRNGGPGKQYSGTCRIATKLRVAPGGLIVLCAASPSPRRPTVSWSDLHGPA